MPDLRPRPPWPPTVSGAEIGQSEEETINHSGAADLAPSIRPAWSLGRWIGRSLSRKFAVAATAGLLAVSLLFLLAFVTLYQGQLRAERALKAAEVNRLLQAALENAMLKRDLAGLRGIVDRLGQEGSIRQVMILNPAGEIRFASDPSRIGGHLLQQPGTADCRDCLPASALTEAAPLQVVTSPEGELLRAVHPVHNQARCAQCHGPVAAHPLNGILVVDHEMATLRTRALHTTGLLMGSGAVVVLLSVAGGWWFINRFVLAPVNRLALSASRLAGGQLEARVAIVSQDEIGQLGENFNRMAASLARSLASLQQQQAFLQNLVDAIPDGVRVIGPDYRIVLANRSYRQQVGQTAAAVTGALCHQSSHQRAYPCPSALIACPLQEILKTGQPVKTLQSFTQADGAPLPVEVYGAPLRLDGDEQRVYLVESVRDLARQIEYSHQQKHATLSLLAAGVAHEIRNPLASIRIALDTLFKLRDGGVRDDEQLYEYLHLADHQIDQCIDITERLLRLSLPPGQTPELVSLHQALRETLSLLQAEAGQRGVAIELGLTPEEARIMGSESEVRILIVNLVQNALHAMPGGGRLRVNNQLQASRVGMVFEDDGTGIRPEDLPYIFDPFFSRRADGAAGTGLGLAICRSIVDRWGGGIEASSQWGHGSRFVVTLPNADAEASL